MTVERLIAAADFSGNPSASVRNGTRKMPPPRPRATPRPPATAPEPKMMTASSAVRFRGFNGFRGFWFGGFTNPLHLLNLLNHLNPKKSARNQSDRVVCDCAHSAPADGDKRRG